MIPNVQPKAEIVMRTASMVAIGFMSGVLAGCSAGGGGPTFTVTRHPAPTQSSESSPCGTINGQPVPCVPYLPGGGNRVGYYRPPQEVLRSWSEAVNPEAAYNGDGLSVGVVYQPAPMPKWASDPQDPRILSVGPTSTVTEGYSYLMLGGQGTPYPQLAGAYGMPSEGVHLHSPYVSGPATLAAIGEPGISVGSAVLPEGGFIRHSPFSSHPTMHFALLANPKAMGWEYQSFGVWNDNNKSRPGGGEVFVVGASYGAGTPASAIPSSGSATFTGKLVGLHISELGHGSSAVADLSVHANFSARSLNLASTGTRLTRDQMTATAAPQLNVSGVLTYSAGANTFSGTLATANGLAGASTGRFYGPAAQEVGGAFALRGSGTETFVGAYGAKR